MPMLSRRLSALSLCVVAIVAIGDTRLGACSCARPGSPCQSASGADMVFAGQVEGIEKLAVPFGPRPMLYDRRVRLRVIEQFTGQTAAEVDIFTHAQSATCGYPFAVGGSYLVYAYRHQDTGLLTTSICSRTSPLARGQLAQGLDLAAVLVAQVAPALHQRGPVARHPVEMPVETAFSDSEPLAEPVDGQRLDAVFGQNAEAGLHPVLYGQPGIAARPANCVRRGHGESAY